MIQIDLLHENAMEMCDLALSARSRRDHAKATEFFRQAFEFERQAAALAEADRSYEPTRSVMHRSAASLALECGDHQAAERLIAIALAGDPPAEIAEELRNLTEQLVRIEEAEEASK